jgi:hypothetical protein
MSMLWWFEVPRPDYAAAPTGAASKRKTRKFGFQSKPTQRAGGLAVGAFKCHQ